VREEPVGRVDQAVEVQQTGDGQIGGDHHGGGHRRRPQVSGTPPHSSEREPDERADRAEPRERVWRRWSSATDRRQEGQRPTHAPPPR
jgi:hypothetical protein